MRNSLSGSGNGLKMALRKKERRKNKKEEERRKKEERTSGLSTEGETLYMFLR